ncbi:phage tail assembly chaperone [Clostridium kluyveri]|uniref:phage tail assembly chaperone n=1 Tax=Clostridium kluyveri TaxID=1534 RepID=UPI0022462EB5|nr:hypothetical protein [Clostridium kluyveri]UZQ49861.1 hypothetical protein OP486_18225 [Clostridium kluyveri]
MSTKMDLLLKVDKSKLVRPIQEVEVKRLSEILGETFTVTCQALAADEFKELENTKTANEDMVIKGVKDPDFTNQQVIEYYGVVTATEAVNTIFLPGEITSLVKVITNLSGFGTDAIKEIKNS